MIPRPAGWILCAAWLVLSPLASAGIYKCVGENGRPSFSQKPCPDSSIKGNGKPEQLWRTMRQLVVDGKTFSTNIQGDVESIRACQEKEADFRGRLDELKKTAQSLALKHPHLYRAHEILYDCGQCRYSALAQCEKADVQLDEAMAGLE